MSTIPTDKVDIDYLKSENIGKVIAKGLAVLYQEKPKFPVDFLAKWLLNYSATVENESKIQHILKEKDELRKKHKDELEAQAKKEEQQKKKNHQIEQKDEDFSHKIQEEQYHNELIVQLFPEYLNNRLGLTGVYIGTKDFSVKEINDNEEDETAHLNINDPQVINYIGYSQNHTFMKGQTLGLEDGVTAEVWIQKEDDPVDIPEGQEAPPPKQTYQYVPDLVKEKQMRYFRLPKLGAFLAVPMIFESYLHDAAFDKGVEQRIRYLAAKEEQEKERAAKEQEFNDKLKELEEQGDPSAEEFKANWENQKANWVDEKEAPFEPKIMEYVLAGDTMGQDREFTEFEKDFLEKYGQLYSESWQQRERLLLSDDIDRQLNYIKALPAGWKDLQQNYIEAEEKNGEQRGAQVEEIKNDHPMEYQYEVDLARLDKVKEQLSDKTFQEQFINLQEYRVFKFPGILQNILYLLGYDRENINLLGTHVLNWKEIKNLLNGDLFDKILEYNPRGQKPDPVKPYALINRLTAQVEQFDQDGVDSYNLCYGRLLRWILLTVQVRKADIIIRREKIEKRKKDRQEAIDKTENIKTEQENYINNKKLEVEELPQEEKDAFNWEDFIKDFDEKNPLPEIPDEVEDDVDNDCEFD